MNGRPRIGAVATIAAGGSQSNELNVGEGEITAISMPAAWTAANITFLGRALGGATFQPVHDQAGAEVTVTAAAGRYIALNETTRALLRGLTQLKLRSGTTAAPVNQVAAAEVTLMVR